MTARRARPDALTRRARRSVAFRGRTAGLQPAATSTRAAATARARRRRRARVTGRAGGSACRRSACRREAARRDARARTPGRPARSCRRRAARGAGAAMPSSHPGPPRACQRISFMPASRAMRRPARGELRLAHGLDDRRAAVRRRRRRTSVGCRAARLVDRDRPLLSSTPSIQPRSSRRGCWPIALTTVSAGRTNSLPGIGSGRGRPLASGAPSSHPAAFDARERHGREADRHVSHRNGRPRRAPRRPRGGTRASRARCADRRA